MQSERFSLFGKQAVSRNRKFEETSSNRFEDGLFAQIKSSMIRQRACSALIDRHAAHWGSAAINDQQLLVSIGVQN
jgi:hypothetical protein